MRTLDEIQLEIDRLKSEYEEAQTAARVAYKTACDALTLEYDYSVDWQTPATVRIGRALTPESRAALAALGEPPAGITAPSFEGSALWSILLDMTILIRGGSQVIDPPKDGKFHDSPRRITPAELATLKSGEVPDHWKRP